MALREFTLQLVGVTATSVSSSTTPAAGKVWTIIGFTLANRISSNVSFDVFKRMPTNIDTYLANGMLLPAFNNHYTIGSLGKHIILPTGLIFVKSSIATSIDVTMTVDESDNT